MPTDHPYANHSTVAGLASAAAARLSGWVAASWLVSITTSLGQRFDDATRTSKLAATLRTLSHYVRASYLYRWLTAEPDPEIVVIDLRETYTVGPFIALLDRVQPSVESAWSTSTLHRLADRLEPNCELLARSRTVRLLAAALEPPEPPKQTHERPSDEDE